jgi:hypothetical protein
MEGHHWGGQGWNSAVEPQEEEIFYNTLEFYILCCNTTVGVKTEFFLTMKITLHLNKDCKKCVVKETRS